MEEEWKIEERGSRTKYWAKKKFYFQTRRAAAGLNCCRCIIYGWKCLVAFVSSCTQKSYKRRLGGPSIAIKTQGSTSVVLWKPKRQLGGPSITIKAHHTARLNSKWIIKQKKDRKFTIFPEAVAKKAHKGREEIRNCRWWNWTGFIWAMSEPRRTPLHWNIKQFLRYNK